MDRDAELRDLTETMNKVFALALSMCQTMTKTY
jgi:hypothetical protein